MKMSQLVDQYVILRVSQSKQYLNALRLAAKRFIEANGDIYIGDIKEDHIGRYLAIVGNYVHSSYTLRGHVAMLKAILKEAFDIGLISRVPRFPRVRVEKRNPDAWTLEETKKLFEYVGKLDGHVGSVPARLWWQSILLAGYYTGLRLSGLLNVYWFQVDLNGQFLRALANKNKREQTFAIPTDLTAILQQIKDPPREKVWEHPYNSKWPCKALRRIVDAAGIPAPKHLHGQLFQKMRRTCITWTAVHDVSMATRVAGHASPETTIKHYVDPRMLGAIKPVVPRIDLKVS